MNAYNDDRYVSTAAEVFALLADGTRIRIIRALRDGELSVGQLTERVGRPQAAVSQHLTKLYAGGMVLRRQEGVRVFYRLADEHALALADQAMLQAEHLLDDTPRHHREHADTMGSDKAGIVAADKQGGWNG